MRRLAQDHAESWAAKEADHYEAGGTGELKEVRRYLSQHKDSALHKKMWRQPELFPLPQEAAAEADVWLRRKLERLEK
jgi:hypothetical protein